MSRAVGVVKTVGDAAVGVAAGVFGVVAILGLALAVATARS